MDKYLHRKFKISGMIIEIISEDGDTWKTRNITTNDVVPMKKSVLERAIRLGMAEEITENENE